MALVTELVLPEFDYLDPTLRGVRFHERMRDLRAQGWLARSPLGCFVLDREGVDFFLKSKQLKFPGALVAELFGVTEGPLHEEVVKNILCIDGADHRRLRSLVNPSLTARSVERYRPAIRGFIEQLYEPVAAAGRCECAAASPQSSASGSTSARATVAIEVERRISVPPAVADRSCPCLA